MTYTVRKFIRPRLNLSGCVLYLPLSQMSVRTSQNLLSNGGMETGDPPTGWTLEGDGAAVVRSQEQVYAGSYSAKLTRAAADCDIKQVLASIDAYKGITLTGRAFNYDTAANRSRVSIYDGVTETFSNYHTGGSAFEELTVSHKLAAAATTGGLWLYRANGAGSCYYDVASLTVPQMQDRSAYGHAVYPEGCIWTPQGFSFDGVDDFIKVLHQSSFNPTTSGITVIVWVNSSATGGRIITKQKASAPFDGFVLTFDPDTPSGKIDLYVRDASTNTVNTRTTLTYNDGWHCVAATIQLGNATGAKIYVDGALVATGNVSTLVDTITTTADLFVGAFRDFTGYLNGRLDMPLLYNRTLTIGEIQTIYQLTRGGKR